MPPSIERLHASRRASPRPAANARGRRASVHDGRSTRTVIAPVSANDSSDGSSSKIGWMRS